MDAHSGFNLVAAVLTQVYADIPVDDRLEFLEQLRTLLAHRCDVDGLPQDFCFVDSPNLN